VFEFAEGFEPRDHFGELRVEPVDLKGVVEQVAANLGGVGSVGRDRDVGEALFSSEGMARESAGGPLAGPPTFAGEAGMVTGGWEEMREDGKFVGQGAGEHARFADLPEVSAGAHGAARRGAGRAGAKRVREPPALARDAAEGGRADRALPADPRVAPRLIVADNKKDVGWARHGGRGLDGSGGVNRGHRRKGGQQGNGNHGGPPQVWRGREER
jgi:hypothetical protein